MSYTASAPVVLTTPQPGNPTVYFYAPNKRSHRFFDQPDLSWAKLCEAQKDFSGNFTSWIVNTYFQLQATDIPCKVVDHLPKQGIVLADRDTLGNHNPYLSSIMLICAKGDREFHPSAHMHVVHNPADSQASGHTVWNPYYIPHWPQPNLIPRELRRGDRVENVAFFGTRSNLSTVFHSDQWIDALRELGRRWMPRFAPNQWQDYSNIDVVVAARSFDRNRYSHKPASKLINCWKSQVPAILAPESAFLATQKTGLDFLTVTSLEETIQAVKRLKHDPQLYQAMVENGLQRSQEITNQTVVAGWQDFFHQHVFPEYEHWCNTSESNKRLAYAQRYAKLKLSRLSHKILPSSLMTQMTQ